MLFTAIAQGAELTAALDKDVIAENEVVQLTLRADYSDTGNGPDFSPLRRDFEIISQSQNSQFSFNLGTNKALNFWVVTLMPKAVGNFQIPSIKVGNYSSQPLSIKVNPAPQLLDENGNAPVMVKFTTNTLSPYVQQQVLLTVELYTSVALQNANLSAPNHPSLLIERLTDDQQRYETINGTAYQVLQRDYIAFAQRSGKLELIGQTIEAMVNTSNGRRRINVKSAPITLDVLPIPPTYSADTWLPAENVTISTKLQGPDEIKVGDTLIWTIDVAAKGALPEQQPIIDIISTRDYKVYPSSPRFSSAKYGSGIVGKQTMQMEIVPTQSGAITLPTISIPYWDTKQRQFKIATSNQEQINVVGLATSKDADNLNNDSSSDSAPLLPPQTKSVAPISLAKPKAAPTPEPTPEPTIALTVEQPEPGTDWRTLGALVLVLLGVAGLLVWWFKQRRSKAEKTDDEVPMLADFAPLSSASETIAYQNLLSCCQQSDLSRLQGNLLEWARHRWGDSHVRGLDDIKRLANSPRLSQLLMEAELVMYSEQAASQWDGSPLADALQEYKTGVTKPSQASQLKTLYPNF
ncbi:BatD family protein [Maribrevibacterium harenarium]|uniref:BatD family protein n=1 Tax=Maribrevibacterium harenarium TaxID=2589817 RepID=UPI001F22D1AC|nr:BatD family protein [Maribrevibacterium harenarium]